MQELENCMLCPRECGVNRLAGQLGFCRMPAQVKAARAALHFWEEPCISGENGSGAVFFSGCTLRCVFCQNHEIAEGRGGKAISPERLSAIFLELQEQGAENINLVTPTHYTPQIIRALDRVKGKLSIPVVYNTSGYEKEETLRRLEGYVDIYLPDFKYMSSELSARWSKAPDYSARAKAALAEMVRQTGKPVFAENQLMKRGVIVRHLLLPGQLLDSRRIIRYLYETYGDDIYISMMNQYTPLAQVKDIPELNRRVKRQSYDRLIDYALELGVTRGFIQEGGTAEESFIPAFDGKGIYGTGEES